MAILPPSDEGGGPPKVVEGEIECAAGMLILQSVIERMIYVKKIISLLLVVIVFFSVYLCSCNNGEVQTSSINNGELKISPEDKSLFELATMMYTDAELEEIRDFEGDLEELHQKYKIECLRETPSGTGYQVAYLGKTKVLLLYFTQESDYILKELITISSHSLEDFRNAITVGQPWSDVMGFDPAGYFYSIGATVISTHITRDGYIFKVAGRDDEIDQNMNDSVVKIRYSIL